MVMKIAGLEQDAGRRDEEHFMSIEGQNQKSYKNTTVYILFKQVQKVPDRKVLLGQAGEIHCADSAIETGCRVLELYQFREKEEKKGFSALDAVALIEKKYPGITVNLAGTPDFLVEYEGARNTSRILEWVKIVLVCIISFFGAAFAIMTFNNDGAVNSIFLSLYEQFTGVKSDGRTVLEAGYSIGLPVGILFFFNHLGKKADRMDPTPLEVQMRLYGDDLAGSVIQKEEEAQKQQKSEDVTNRDK